MAIYTILSGMMLVIPYWISGSVTLSPFQTLYWSSQLRIAFRVVIFQVHHHPKDWSLKELLFLVISPLHPTMYYWSWKGFLPRGWNIIDSKLGWGIVQWFRIINFLVWSRTQNDGTKSVFEKDSKCHLYSAFLWI